MSALFIILVDLTMTRFSEKMLISNRCIHGFMSNLIKKSWRTLFLRLNYKLWSFEYRGNKHIRLIPFPFLIIRIKLYYFKFVLFTTKKHTERKGQRNKNILSRYLKSQLQFEPNPKLFLSRYLNHKLKFEIAFKIYLSLSIR